MPPIYYQLKAIKKFWTKSKSQDKEAMIEMLNRSIKQIEEEYS